MIDKIIIYLGSLNSFFSKNVNMNEKFIIALGLAIGVLLFGIVLIAFLPGNQIANAIIYMSAILFGSKYYLNK